MDLPSTDESALDNILEISGEDGPLSVSTTGSQFVVVECASFQRALTSVYTAAQGSGLGDAVRKLADAATTAFEKLPEYQKLIKEANQQFGALSPKAPYDPKSQPVTLTMRTAAEQLRPKASVLLQQFLTAVTYVLGGFKNIDRGIFVSNPIKGKPINAFFGELVQAYYPSSTAKPDSVYKKTPEPSDNLTTAASGLPGGDMPKTLTGPLKESYFPPDRTIALGTGDKLTIDPKTSMATLVKANGRQYRFEKKAIEQIGRLKGQSLVDRLKREDPFSFKFDKAHALTLTLKSGFGYSVVLAKGEKELADWTPDKTSALTGNPPLLRRRKARGV